MKTLQELETKIEIKEAQLAEIKSMMLENGTDAKKLEALFNEKQILEDQLEKDYEAWQVYGYDNGDV